MPRAGENPHNALAIVWPAVQPQLRRFCRPEGLTYLSLDLICRMDGMNVFELAKRGGAKDEYGMTDPPMDVRNRSR